MMGDVGDSFKEYNEAKKDERKRIEPPRFAYSVTQLSDYDICVREDNITINLRYGTVTFWPFTGWFQGQKPYGRIKGRGIKNLVKALKND